MSELERGILVTRHAIDQLRERRPLVYADFSNEFITKIIRREVAAALVAGRMSQRKPLGFRLHGDNKARLADHQRIVWGAAAELAWVITRESSADVVVTTLTRASAAE